MRHARLFQDAHVAAIVGEEAGGDKHEDAQCALAVGADLTCHGLNPHIVNNSQSISQRSGHSDTILAPAHSRPRIEPAESGQGGRRSFALTRQPRCNPRVLHSHVKRAVGPKSSNNQAIRAGRKRSAELRANQRQQHRGAKPLGYKKELVPLVPSALLTFSRYEQMGC